jgi:hypothetical protein
MLIDDHLLALPSGQRRRECGAVLKWLSPRLAVCDGVEWEFSPLHRGKAELPDGTTLRVNRTRWRAGDEQGEADDIDQAIIAATESWRDRPWVRVDVAAGWNEMTSEQRAAAWALLVGGKS